eukprot:TRINITY_DN7846_c0_g1_i1.p1 TRINITY_DN7846_c0_g1~~TRINITY_DN7846_c0_g1_i1.p1  ORF type:complete len:1293 (-),score=227.72 TRINITY_DN7846_c0_g1_i1:107-3985(-)
MFAAQRRRPTAEVPAARGLRNANCVEAAVSWRTEVGGPGSSGAFPSGTGADIGAEAYPCKVYLRVRPRRPREALEPQGVDVFPGKATVQLTNGQDLKTFTVDEVFDSGNPEGRGTQAHVFSLLGRQLVEQAVQGFNVCVIAFGPTGSGKTYSIVGVNGASAELCGLLPRTVKELFAQHAQDPKQKAYSYSCEYYEVYNDQIRDLLAPSKTDKLRKVHVHPKHGVRIEGLSSCVVTTPEEAIGLLNFGNQMRAVTATTMNEHSSRSHAIFTLRCCDVTQDSKRGYHSCEQSLTFLDLAGSEDLSATAGFDQSMREMCHIDNSLSELTQLVSKLADSQKCTMADCRRSKLTTVLSQAFLGNCRSTVLATLPPVQSQYNEAWVACNFAANARKIQTRASPNSKTSQMLLQELEAEARSLRKAGAGDKESDVLACQAMLSYYKESFDDAVSKSKEDSKLRKRLAAKLGLADSDEAHPRTEFGQLAPFLTKLTDDPAFQGCCNYFIRRPMTQVGSDRNTCDVVLNGVGVKPQTCELRLQLLPSQHPQLPAPSLRVSLQLSGAGGQHDRGARVLVNGEPMRPRTIRALSHGDCIILGFAHAFRLVVPSEATLEAAGADAAGGPTDAATLARSSLGNLDLASVLREVRDDGPRFQEALACVQKLTASRVGDHHVQAFVRTLQTVCPLVDEANVITREVFGEQNQLSLKLHAMSPMWDSESSLPELAICLNHAQSQRRYIWSLDKFLCRLREMREVYHEGVEAKDFFAGARRRLEAKRHTSPWHEINQSDMQTLLQEGGVKRSDPSGASGVTGAGKTPGKTVEATPSPSMTARSGEQEVPLAPCLGAPDAGAGRSTSVGAARGSGARSPPSSAGMLISTRITPPAAQTQQPQQLLQMQPAGLSGCSVSAAAAVAAAVRTASPLLVASDRGRGDVHSPTNAASDGSGSGTAVLRPSRPDSPEAASVLPGVTHRDLQELRTELTTCRQETGRLFTEQGRMAGLLDRFEGLLCSLSGGGGGRSSSPRPAEKTPVVSRQASGVARAYQVSYLGPSSPAAPSQPSASSGNSPLSGRVRRFITPPMVVHSKSAGGTDPLGSPASPSQFHRRTDDMVRVLTERPLAEEAALQVGQGHSLEAPRSPSACLQSAGPLRGSGEGHRSPRASSCRGREGAAQKPAAVVLQGLSASVAPASGGSSAGNPGLSMTIATPPGVSVSVPAGYHGPVTPVAATPEPGSLTAAPWKNTAFSPRQVSSALSTSTSVPVITAQHQQQLLRASGTANRQKQLHVASRQASAKLSGNSQSL